MLEPLSALSLAVNIFQIIDFGSKLLVEGYAAYRSAEGTSAEHVELEQLTSDLQRLSDSLSQPLPPKTRPLSPSEQAVETLARDCKTTAGELLELLGTLKIQSTGPLRTWDAARQAARRIWKKEKIERLQGQLEQYKSLINTHVMNIMRESVSLVLSSIDDMKSRNEALQTEIMVQLCQTKTSLLEAMNRQEQGLAGLRSNQQAQQQLERQRNEFKKGWRKEIREQDRERVEEFDEWKTTLKRQLEEESRQRSKRSGGLQRPLTGKALNQEVQIRFRDRFGDVSTQALSNKQLDQEVQRRYQQRALDIEESIRTQYQAYQANLPRLIDKLALMHDQGHITATKQQILDSLHFHELPVRHRAIAHAHEGTYNWILDADRTTFKSWLEWQNGIFWVSGKAGSGKSTLLKFLDDHPTTETTLRHWASQKSMKLVKASFYFWNSGFPMQRTLEGLLRGLLHQILRQCPDLIPIAFPARWVADESFHRNPSPWGHKELSDGLRAILMRDEQDVTARFCFFIDGLDEFEGDHRRLTNDLKAIGDSEFVKLCVSSRPWTEFNDAFAHKKDRLLTLQDLTRGDMECFIRDIVSRDERFEKLYRLDPQAQTLISQILDKAEGVFLWVYLVIHALCRGLNQHDDIPILQRRLDRLPTDLNKYFQHILNNIDPDYQDHTARIFQLATKDMPLPLAAFWYVEKELHHPEDLARDPLVEPLSQYNATEFLEKATHRINAWCRDLLEVQVNPLPQHSCDRAFLERNVFLTHRISFLHRTVREFLELQTAQNQLSKYNKTEFKPWLSLVRVYLVEAKSLNISRTHASTMQYFPEIAGEVMYHAAQYELHCGDVPTMLIDELDRVGTHYRQSAGAASSHWTKLAFAGEGDFLAYAVSFGLTKYVQEKLNAWDKPKCRFQMSRLLDFALQDRLEHSRLAIRPTPNMEMVRMLLQNGASLNLAVMPERNPSYSSWHRFLQRCQTKKDQNLWPTVEFLVGQGVDLGGRVGGATAYECLDWCCPPSKKDSLEKIWATRAMPSEQKPSLKPRSGWSLHLLPRKLRAKG